MPWRRGNINGLSILWQLGLDETLRKIDAYGLPFHGRSHGHAASHSRQVWYRAESVCEVALSFRHVLSWRLETGWSRSDTVNKEFLAIEFKRKQDVRSNYVEKATAAAQEQYKSPLTKLQAVGLGKGWKVQQVVFVGGTCGSVHVESFNRNMKTLGVLESKWDPIRKKLVRRLLEEQDKVLRSYFA